MEWARILYTLPLYLAAALAFSYFLYALRNRPSPIAIPFAALMLSVIIWTAADALALDSLFLPYQIFWMKFSYFGKASLPVAYLWFAYEFTSHKRKFLKPFIPVFFLETLLASLLIWSRGTQSLFFKSIEQVFVSPLYLLNITFGPVFWLQTGFIYILLATGSYFLFKDFWNLTPSYRNRFVIIILCVVLPAIANIATLFRLSPLPYLDLTPYAFLIIEFVILWAIIHFHLLEIMAIAQQTIVENLNEAILVVDIMDKVIYSNRIAGELLGLPNAGIIGKPVVEVWPIWSELVRHFPEPDITDKTPALILQQEIQQGNETPQRWYRLEISHLHDQGGLRFGKLIIWNDITPSKQTDEAYQFGQERQRQLVDNSPNPIFSIDRQRKIKSWNPACETTFKYGKEIIDQELYLLLPQQEKTILDEKLAHIFEHGSSIDNIDLEFIRKDGSSLHMVSRLYPLSNQSGEIDTCVIANTDVTERKHAQETLSRQFEELRVLHSVALACVEATNEDALIERVTEIIGATFFPDNFGVLLFDETTNLLHRHASYRERVEKLPHEYMQFGKGITSLTIQTGQPVRVADVCLEPAYFEVDRLTRSELCVPLKTGERVIGVINTESTQLSAFTDSDERLLTILAGQMASAIERLRAAAAEQHRAQELLAITRISQEINSSLDLQQVLDSIVRYAAEISNSSAGGLFLYQPDGRLGMVATYGVSDEFIKLIDAAGLNEPGSAVGRAIRQRRPYQIPDIAKDQSYAMRYAADLENIQAILALPMFRGEEIIGGIVIWNRQPHSFSQEEERFLQALANQSVNAVENARLFEAEREQRKLAEVMRDVGSRLSSFLDFDELLDNLLEQLERVVPYDGANVMLVDGDFIHVARIRGYERFDPAFVQIVHSLTLEISTTANLRTMLETRTSLFVPDTDQDPDWIQIAPEYPVRSWAGVPIFIQGQAKAIFSLDKAEPGFYQPEHARRLGIYAGQVGLALQNSNLFMVTQQQAEQMAELAVLGGELNRPLTVEEVVRGIGLGSLTLGKARRAAVYLREAEDSASCVWFQGLSANYVRQVTKQLREVPGNQLFHSLEPVLVSDTEKLAEDSLIRKLAQQEPFRAVGLWPLVYEGKVVAAVGIYYESPHAWDESQKEILLAFTRQSAIAIQNTRLFSETKRRAAQQEALNKIIAEAVKAPDLPYLVETVLDLTLEAFGSDMGGAWLAGISALRGLPASLGNAEAQMARQQDSIFYDTVVVEDWRQPEFETHPWREIMDVYQIRASLSVPILSGGKRIGGLAIAADTARTWQPDEITLAEAIGQQVGSAAERLDLLKQTQEQARQVQMIIDTVPEGVLLLDVTHRVILANPAARKYLSALLGEVEFDGPLTHLANQPVARLLEESAQPNWHELQTSGEHNQIFELAAQPLEVDSEISGWVLVLRDVSEERANLTRVQMQERLATVGQLAAGIAHDFNNIMAAIVVYTDLLAIDPDLHPNNREHVKIIQQQIQRASSLIRQILDFSRRSIMEPSPIDLLPFVKELDKLLGRILPENILLRLSYTPGVYMIRADPTSLQQIFMNLALNARDAMSNGGVLQFALTRLMIAENERPPLPELTPGNWIRLSISDNGIGIQENTLPHIFDPFYTTKPVGKGTGLGLAQVYGIVKQHGGSIDVQSALGEGTTFRLYFPELPAPEKVTVSPTLSSIPRGEGEMVLLVEDDSATREALEYLLENQNYNVYTAQDGIEALRLYNQPGLHFDLVISDIVMPGMGGLKLYSMLREREPNIRILFITGHPMELENQALLEESRLNWLQKPFSMQEFISAIRLALINLA
jgi:PAS domain S-box-containing protein